jgi:V/A-type H+-transporting ATPase subunit K
MVCLGILNLVAVFVALSFFDFAWAEKVSNPDTAKWAFMSAALVMGLSAIGAGIAIAYVGAAAVGAMSEKPELAAKALPYVGLAEGIAVLGFALAFMILKSV